MIETPRPWYVYVLLSGKASLPGKARSTYVGVCTDPLRRLAQHNGRMAGGAKATRARRPWVLGALYGPYGGRAEVLRAEARVKARRGRARLKVPGEPPASPHDQGGLSPLAKRSRRG